MRLRLLAVTMFLLSAAHVLAHRLDEYLQGTIVSIEKNRVSAEMTLTPGVAVFPRLIAEMDTDGNGVISPSEQDAYTRRMLHDLSLRIDGRALTPQLRSVEFPAIEEMKEGRGEIRVAFGASLPPGGADRKLVIENRHEPGISAYQVNCLVPRDRDIRISAQKRNYTQSFYELDFTQAGVRSDSSMLGWLNGNRRPLGTVALIVFAWLALLWGQRSMRPKVGLARFLRR